jgi:2-methylisocitrate lyase-like PEP mutase family enzyme
MCAKLRAAVDARRDPNLLIIARTDALQSEGWHGAEARARAYMAAGADMIFVDEIRTPQDLAEYARRLGDLPRVYNGPLPSAEVARLGFRLMLHPGTLGRLYQSLRDTCYELQQGALAPTAEDQQTFDAIIRLLGVPEQLALSERYREADDDRA